MQSDLGFVFPVSVIAVSMINIISPGLNGTILSMEI